ncbi:unnamed protein product [Allacma fusca]|uniref:Uncharacterized protein n=1 Tax=Allacma fusca TaxID=39272 RepID=A0A8J2NMK8_9HEXA|nr:unnamed protein product [Allacma fusca]
MITIHQARPLLIILKFFSYLNIIPIDVDTVRGKFGPKTPFQKGVWNILFILANIRLLYSFVNVATELLEIARTHYNTGINWVEIYQVHTIPMKLIAISYIVIGLLWIYSAMVNSQDVTLSLINQLFSVRDKKTRWTDLTSFEWLAILVVYNSLALPALPVAFFLSAHNNNYFLYCMLPVSWKNTYVFCAYVFLEYCFTGFVSWNLIVNALVTLYFPLKGLGRIRLVMRKILPRKGNWFIANGDIQRAHHEFRQIQLWAQFINASMSMDVFLFKLYCSGVATFSLTFAILFAHSNWIYSLTYFSLGMQTMGAYVTVTDANIAMLEEIEDSKTKFLLRIRTLRPDQGSYTLSWDESLPEIMIHIGCFTTVHKDSTPNFVIFVTTNTIRALIFFNRKDLLEFSHFPFHIMAVLGSTVCAHWMYKCFVACPEIFIAIFNRLLVDNSNPKKFIDLTQQEKIAITIPYNFMLMPVLQLGIILYDPLAQYFMFGMMSSQWQTPFFLHFFIILESVILATILAGQSLIVFMLLLFFQRCNTNVSNGLASLSLRIGRHFISSRDLWRAYRDVRELQTWLHLFNSAFRYNIFTAKFFCVTISIVYVSFGVITFYSKALYPIYLLIGVEMVAVYVVLFDKAFIIPSGINKYKRKILSVASILCKQHEAMIRRKVISIPVVGFHIGQFHLLERASSPNFLRFVSINTMRVLIACKQDIYWRIESL